MNAKELLELINAKKEMQNALNDAISVAYQLGFDSVAAEVELLLEKFTNCRERLEDEYMAEILGR